MIVFAWSTVPVLSVGMLIFWIRVNSLVDFSANDIKHGATTFWCLNTDGGIGQCQYSLNKIQLRMCTKRCSYRFDLRIIAKHSEAYVASSDCRINNQVDIQTRFSTSDVVQVICSGTSFVLLHYATAHWEKHHKQLSQECTPYKIGSDGFCGIDVEKFKECYHEATSSNEITFMICHWNGFTIPKIYRRSFGEFFRHVSTM
ncbi:hypothetical protein CHS0354_040484 [Potamilus streckersoni]|uniref:Uncharacterized protein n=1 Tax=Potamilus streckersoni TaxID=2493646 RepID=A0AAE0TK20_9BIVA|nr:hypothetical protein CHS0354_040484 [Potamilus streckersoni]